MTDASYYVLLTHDDDTQRLFYVQIGGLEIPMVVRDDPTLLRLAAVDQGFHIYQVWPGLPVAQLAVANEGRELSRGMADREILLDADFSRDIARAVSQGNVYVGRHHPSPKRAAR